MNLALEADQSAKDQSRAPLMNVLRQLADRHGWKHDGQPRTPALLSMLLEEPCERSLLHRLSTPPVRDPTKFDPVYREKSTTATGFILMTVVDALEKAGHSAGISTEARDPVGTFDIVVVEGSPCLVLKKGTPAVRIEVKGSMGIPLLSQITRYTLSPTPLIIARVMLNQVVVLEPMKLRGFTDFATELLDSRAHRLLENRPVLVPGPYCKGCPDVGCPYNQIEGGNHSRLVTMEESEFQNDLSSFYTNLPGVSHRVAAEVLRFVGEVHQS